MKKKIISIEEVENEISNESFDNSTENENVSNETASHQKRGFLTLIKRKKNIRGNDDSFENEENFETEKQEFDKHSQTKQTADDNVEEQSEKTSVVEENETLSKTKSGAKKRRKVKDVCDADDLPPDVKTMTKAQAEEENKGTWLQFVGVLWSFVTMFFSVWFSMSTIVHRWEGTAYASIAIAIVVAYLALGIGFVGYTMKASKTSAQTRHRLKEFKLTSSYMKMSLNVLFLSLTAIMAVQYSSAADQATIAQATVAILSLIFAVLTLLFKIITFIFRLHLKRKFSKGFYSVYVEKDGKIKEKKLGNKFRHKLTKKYKKK